MRSITFIRHAQSIPLSPGIKTDFDRPLSYIGKKQCHLMSRKLAERFTDIEHWHISSSTRTVETYHEFVSVWSGAQARSEHDSLYLASFKELKRFIRALPIDQKHVAIICHNPSITNFGFQFSPQLSESVPTAGIYRLIFDVDSWSNISTQTAKLDFFIYPKLFTN